MTGGGDLPYAIYTMGGFSALLEFGQLTLDATAAGDAQLYVGLANYSSNAWEWTAADSGGWSTGPLVGANYRSPLGNASVAVVLDGSGTGSVNSLTFGRTGATDLVPPDPISADPSVGRIIISWTEVPVAEGYNVYRDVEPALSSPEKLNTEPVTKLSYSDLSVTAGVMYYYFVTSVGGGDESDPSQMLDVFAPEVNLSMPQNTRVIDSTEDSATVAWDWTGPPPTEFQLYLEDHKDFNLVSPLQDPTVSGSTTQYRFNGLDQGTTYHWRVCGVFGSNRGNMTDDRATETGTNNQWTWSPVENAGTGYGTVVAVKAGSDLAAAYLHDDSVKFSKRTSGSWSEETVLSGTPYQSYFDMAYGSGKYGIAGYADYPGDMWVAVGTPGSFNSERIHGDGNEELGHFSSGLNCTIIITSSEYVVVHTDFEGGNTLVQTLPLTGGSWTLETISSVAMLDTPYCLTTDGSNAYLLTKDIGNNQLLFGNMNSGWSLGVAIPPSSPAVTFPTDMVRLGGQWASPVRDATNKRFILVKGTTVPWSVEELNSSNVGNNARMDVENTKAGIVYTAAGEWWFAFSDGGPWDFSTINVAGTISGRPDIVFLNGSPYIVFADSSSDTIKAAKGTPPPL
jgi:hypothetical protein